MRKSSIKLTDNQIKAVYFRILRDMILEIRAAAYVSNNKEIYHKADLIHNIPYILSTDGNENQSERLQSNFDWFSIHYDFDGPHHQYVKAVIDDVRSSTQ